MPHDVWPSAKTFWDLIGRAADESPLPFMSIAIRSDPPTWGSQQIARELMAALPNHPLAERLAFVDPLAFAALPAGEPSRASAPRRHWLRTIATELESKAA